MDCDVASYHVESFNFLVDFGLQEAALDVPPVKMSVANERIQFSYVGARLGTPTVEGRTGRRGELSVEQKGTKLYPAECRQRGINYSAPLKLWVDLTVGGINFGSMECYGGEVPVMLRSKCCNLHGMDSDKLVAHGEEASERGGYFICKGSEKVIRLLVANKRNYPLALCRPSMREKGRLFSPYAVMMRCFRGNHLASLINVHYLENASMVISIQCLNEIFYVPLMYVLKCFTDMSDRSIFEHMTRARPGDTFWAGCVTNMLSMAQNDGVITSNDAHVALGSRFRVMLEQRYGKNESDKAMTRHLLDRCVAIHLKADEQKFFCLVMMAQKLIALVKGEIQSESQDNPQFQEASVSGHIMLLVIREKLERMLLIARKKLEILATRNSTSFLVTTETFIKAFAGAKNELTNALQFLLSTGNLNTKDGLGLMQRNGFSVIAERINQLRFLSHFRAIHRGAFFMEMRTTDVRKLRPEAWGYICPVHTPDGSPCGLLNHLTASCRIVTHPLSTDRLRGTLVALGVMPHASSALLQSSTTEQMYPVVVDGDFFGYVHRSGSALIERSLRAMKVDSRQDSVPYMSEITLIRASSDPENITTQYPGLYIYTVPGRLIRPVRNMALNRTEFIGMFEQVYLSVIIDGDEAEPGVTMHQELHPSALFSFAGNLIPFPDHNQSPRNVYQCQMGKQTMGVPVHALHCRADNKMYLLQTPQDPLIKLAAHDKYGMRDYPLGTHACVAVISYTGYDMEDAMVINKGSYQRGFAHGCVIKVERIDLSERKGFTKTCDRVFYANPNVPIAGIGRDGLPIQGRLYRKDDVYYSCYHRDTGTFSTHKFKSSEPAYCGSVRVVFDDEIREGKTHALIQWRISRNPIIGDKFASRHGQKGINSFLWPAESMPFSESGMMPDIIFNPHGFPSRMTIGMMIESMAGKAACALGTTYDASPFVFGEQNKAIDYFGRMLTKAGYNYHGNETLYSGVDGKQMEVQIFFGIVYYQRLRHMIADKFQVRSTGSVDPVTLQPVKGRKMGGGIRFGEMERDALISHGTAFCLQDRLFNCSDKDEAYVCSKCGSLLSVTKLCKKKAEEEEKRRIAAVAAAAKAEEADEAMDVAESEVPENGGVTRKVYKDTRTRCLERTAVFERQTQVHNFSSRHCIVCSRADAVHLVQVPRVFRYLCAELASMNVKVVFDVAHPRAVTRV